MIKGNFRKLMVLFGVFVVLNGILFSVEVDGALTSGTVRIMPLGDSITLGFPGIEGYRRDLYLNLNGSGFNIDFVGSQENGTAFDNDHEGHSSFHANQIRDNVTVWLNNNPTDVILLHIGTNDIESGQDAAGIVTEVSGILNNIDQWESTNGKEVTVILARIILRSDNVIWNASTKLFNIGLEAMALGRIASGDKVILVNMENALRYPNDLIDGLHPTTLGYERMSDVWYNALINIIGFSLTVNVVGQGVVTKLPNQPAYPPGTRVNLTASALEGWTFNGWSGDVVSSSNPTNITMNSNKTVTATFTQMYKLTISANVGTTTPLIGEHFFAAGSNVTISASSPANGTNDRYSWGGWTGSGAGSYSGTTNQVNITMNGPITEVASWKTEYKLTLSSNSGTTIPLIGQNWFEAGTPVTITASPPAASADTRSAWGGWNGSGAGSYSGINNPATIVMNGPINETALWNTEYKLSIMTSLGTTQPAAGEHWYLSGAPVTVESIPPSAQSGVQYASSGWSGTGSVPASGSGSSASFTMNSPSSITWSWKTQYYLTVSSSYGSVGGAGWYDDGSSAYATITPTTVVGSSGVQYIFNGWSGGASGSSSSSNAIVMNSPKTAIASWLETSTNTPTPTPTQTTNPSPNASTSPSPTSSPSSTVGPTPNSLFDFGNYFIYVLIGLIIVIVSAVAVVAYRKMNKQNLLLL